MTKDVGGKNRNPPDILWTEYGFASCFLFPNEKRFFLILSELLRTMRTGRLQCVELGLEQTCRHFKISSIFVELKKRVKKPCIIFISPQINFLIVSTLKLCLFPCLSNQCKEYFNGFYSVFLILSTMHLVWILDLIISIYLLRLTSFNVWICTCFAPRWNFSCEIKYLPLKYKLVLPDKKVVEQGSRA